MKRFITSLLSTAMLLSATTMPAFAEEDTVIEEETIEIGEPAEDPECHWEFVGDVAYWIEHGKRQGVYGDPLNVWDTQYDKVERGREIYDPESDDWYWLDACYDGAAAVSKECWFPYVFQGEAPGSTDGKWVRYDHHGGGSRYSMNMATAYLTERCSITTTISPAPCSRAILNLRTATVRIRMPKKEKKTESSILSCRSTGLTGHCR